MKNLLILLALATFIMVPSGQGFTQELVLNGDLELWDDANTPTDWPKAENISQATDPVHGGTYSAGHMSADGTQDFQQDITGIVGGANYTISYYFLDNVTDARHRIWSYWLDGDTYLDDNEEELRPTTYSSNSPDWQHYSVSLTAPANADGFRFEVRVYKEDGSFGGLVYYDDFSVMAAGISPEPTNYPTDFTATASGIIINLGWTDATGEQLPGGYLVLASDEDNITAPVDGTPVADDTDLSDGTGALNIPYGQENCSFGDLEPNADYFFMIFPYTNGGANIDYKNDGTAPAATATTADITVILSENFNNGWGGWDRISVTGQQEWEIDDIHGMGGTPCAKCSGYEGQAFENEDWLISPPVNFDNFGAEVLSFYTADAYDGPALEALISNDYDGSDPTTATWTNLEFETSTGYFEWISSGNIDVSNINGTQVYIAFKFTSTSQESATWEVDDVLLTGTGSSGISEKNNLDVEISIYPNPAGSQVTVNAATKEALHLSVYSLTGMEVSETITFTGTYRLDLEGLNNGIYMLQFSDSRGNSAVEKLIIDK